MAKKNNYLTGSGRFLKDKSIFVFQILKPIKNDKGQNSLKIIKEITGHGEKEFKSNFLKEIRELRNYSLDITKYSFSNLFYKGEYKGKEVEGTYSSTISASIALFIKKELWGINSL